MGLQLDPQRTRYAAFVIGLVVFVVILFLIAPLIWSVLQIFILAALITLALEAPVRWQIVRGVPRWAATLNVMFILLVLLIAIFSFIIPPVLEQFRQFIIVAPSLWNTFTGNVSSLLQRYPAIADSVDFSRFSQDLLASAGTLGSAVRSVFATAFGAATATILIFMTVVYTLLNPWPLLYGIRGLFPTEWWSTVDHIGGMIAMRIRAWVIGTIVLAVLIGLLDYLALFVTNLFFAQKIPFILFFAILGGMLEVVPVIGPIIATVLATLVAFAVNPTLGLLVLMEFFLIQQLEANVITPMVMHRAVQLHPVTLLFVLVILSGIFGLFGALIAVPVAAVMKVLYDEWYYPLTHQGKHPMRPPKEIPPGATEAAK